MHDLKSDIPLTRAQLRANYRQLRRALSAKQQQQASAKILDICVKSTLLKRAKVVACYLPNDGEISPQAIMDYCWMQGKTVLLPVLHPFSPGHLVFAHYSANSKMQPNKFGILEPALSTSTLYPLADIDLIFTPLVAFDAKGNRLGMGGGFYDRTLAPIHRDNLATQLIGLAHDSQRANSLNVDSWDIPLHGIATPSDFFKVK